MINIKKLSLEEKRQLLAMLQASLGEKVEEVKAPAKPTEYQIESRKCNEFAKLMVQKYNKIGQLPEFDVVVKRQQKIAYER